MGRHLVLSQDLGEEREKKGAQVDQVALPVIPPMASLHELFNLSAWTSLP